MFHLEGMEIFGRNVDAVRYHYLNDPLVNVYVRQNPGDCKKERVPSYKCIGDCDKSLVVVRFVDKHPFSVKALVPQELGLHKDVCDLRNVKDLSGLEAVARKEGYLLRDVKHGKVLYLHGKQVGYYNPCGLTINEKLFSPEINSTIKTLVERVDEVYLIATTLPFDAILEDHAVFKHIDNPVLLAKIEASFGIAGVELVRFLQSKKRH